MSQLLSDLGIIILVKRGKWQTLSRGDKEDSRTNYDIIITTILLELFQHVFVKWPSTK